VKGYLDHDCSLFAAIRTGPRCARDRLRPPGGTSGASFVGIGIITGTDGTRVGVGVGGIGGVSVGLGLFTGSSSGDRLGSDIGGVSVGLGSRTAAWNA
jgi:hypothetical protein